MSLVLSSPEYKGAWNKRGAWKMCIIIIKGELGINGELGIFYNLNKRGVRNNRTIHFTIDLLCILPTIRIEIGSRNQALFVNIEQRYIHVRLVIYMS